MLNILRVWEETFSFNHDSENVCLRLKTFEMLPFFCYHEHNENMDQAWKCEVSVEWFLKQYKYCHEMNEQDEENIHHCVYWIMNLTQFSKMKIIRDLKTVNRVSNYKSNLLKKKQKIITGNKNNK